MENKVLFVNASMTAVHVVVNALLLFILYRVALMALGVERLGVWSLLLASSSVGTVFQLAFTNGIVKFVAKYIARKNMLTVVEVIETTVIFVSLFHAVFLASLYPILKIVIGYLLIGSYLQEALTVLPYVLGALWLFLVGYVYQYALDGFQLNAIRKLLLIFAVLIQLAVTYLTIPHYGVLGLAYAQIAQSLIQLFGALFLLRRQVKALHLLPRSWNQEIFTEIFHFSKGLQVMSLTQMAIDPITKALITKFGGLAMTGYYDLAFRLVFQVRSMLVVSTEVLLPAIVTLVETNHGKIRQVYTDAFSLILFISIPCYTLLILFLPFISRIWLGSTQTTFIAFSTIMAIGLFFNTICSPAWIIQIGTSRIKWIVIASLTLAMLNVLLGASWGYVWGGRYVVMALALSYSVSSLIVIFAYLIENKVPFRSLIATEHLLLLIGAECALYFFYKMSREGYSAQHFHHAELAYFIASIGGLLILSLPTWFHPVRIRLTSYAKRQLLKRKTC